MIRRNKKISLSVPERSQTGIALLRQHLLQRIEVLRDRLEATGKTRLEDEANRGRIAEARQLLKMMELNTHD